MEENVYYSDHHRTIDIDCWNPTFCDELQFATIKPIYVKVSKACLSVIHIIKKHI